MELIYSLQYLNGHKPSNGDKRIYQACDGVVYYLKENFLMDDVIVKYVKEGDRVFPDTINLFVKRRDSEDDILYRIKDILIEYAKADPYQFIAVANFVDGVVPQDNEVLSNDNWDEEIDCVRAWMNTYILDEVMNDGKVRHKKDFRDLFYSVFPEVTDDNYAENKDLQELYQVFSLNYSSIPDEIRNAFIKSVILFTTSSSGEYSLAMKTNDYNIKTGSDAMDNSVWKFILLEILRKNFIGVQYTINAYRNNKSEVVGAELKALAFTSYIGRYF